MPKKTQSKKLSKAVLPPIERLSDAQIVDIVAHKTAIMSFFNAAEKYMLSEMQKGRKFPGFKLVEGRSKRMWLKDKRKVVEGLKRLGVENPYKERQVMNITDAESILGKGMLGALTIKPAGKLKIVEESHAAQEVLVKDDALGLLTNLNEEKRREQRIKPMAKKKKNLIATPVGRLNFVYLTDPDVGREYSDDKFKVDLLFPKETWKEEGKELKKAVIKTAQAHFGDTGITKLSHLSHHPFKDGDDKNPDSPSSKPYVGHMYITAKSDFKPMVVKPDGKTVMSDEEVAKVKSGDYARLVVAPYGYNQQGGGITLGLNVVQFYKEGEALGGAGNAAAMELLSELEVDLGDVDLDDDEDDE